MGGGRTLRAKASRLGRAGLGCKQNVDSVTKIGSGSLQIAVGAAVLAVMQTVHFAESTAFEWWCAMIATTDHRVSSKQRYLTHFADNRINES